MPLSGGERQGINFKIIQYEFFSLLPLSLIFPKDRWDSLACLSMSLTFSLSNAGIFLHHCYYLSHILLRISPGEAMEASGIFFTAM